MPAAASLGRTDAVVNQLNESLVQNPLIQDVVSFAGWDLLAGGLKTNGGVAFINMKDWAQRQGAGQDAASLARQIAGDGRSDWLKGVQLLAVYLVFGMAFFFIPVIPVP